MNDDWKLPVPEEDPEARKPPVGGGSGCPIVPDGNFVEGAMDEDSADRRPEPDPGLSWD
ncbi:MAG TPA: hypothetical protein VE053_09075 [Allosphingosinicella sp.]|nr:hypothetical protein [Allosphingosinicella sp.]